MRGVACFLWLLGWLAHSVDAQELPNLLAIKPDLEVPLVVQKEAAAGLRVESVTPGWEHTLVKHALYLPRDWHPGNKLPVLVEFPGNGGFRNRLGDVSDGSVDGCVLGYGLSGGEGFIWVSLPFIEVASDGRKRNCTTWWGDVEETKKYCLATLRDIVERYDGDDTRTVLCGFSRGAIGCNYIGLHDEEIAKAWRAFFCHSHYDGVRRWPYPDSDANSALQRLQRLAGRAVWISHEGSISDTQSYLSRTGVEAPFTFVAIPYANHNAAWVLRDIPQRKQAREWLDRVIRLPIAGE